MVQVKSLKLLKGKMIERTVVTRDQQFIIQLYSDDTCAAFEYSPNGGLRLSTADLFKEMSIEDLSKLGLISQKAYEYFVNERQNEIEAYRKQVQESYHRGEISREFMDECVREVMESMLPEDQLPPR